MNNNIEILDKINKGCFMGIEAINLISKKTDDPNFSDLLNKQKEEYISFACRIEEIYRSYNNEDAKDVGIMGKTMLTFGIEKETLLDESISNLADILIKGTNMGIVEGRKLINNKKMDKKITKLVKDFIKMQENYIDKLKDYL